MVAGPNPKLACNVDTVKCLQDRSTNIELLVGERTGW